MENQNKKNWTLKFAKTLVMTICIGAGSAAGANIPELDDRMDFPLLASSHHTTGYERAGVRELKDELTLYDSDHKSMQPGHSEVRNSVELADEEKPAPVKVTLQVTADNTETTSLFDSTVRYLKKVIGRE